MRFLLLLICCLPAFGQKQYDIAQIPDSLMAGANAVVRDERITIEIADRRNMTITRNRVVTVFNESGLKCMNTAEYRPVWAIEATILDATGKLIKEFKRKDFKVTAASDSFITDNKTTYLEFTPASYPFTVVYKSVVTDNNTAFIGSWMPVQDYFCSVQNSVFSISVPANLGLKYKLVNERPDMKTARRDGAILFSLSNLTAVKQEQYAPGLDKLVPLAYFGLDRFHLEGVDGEASSWEAFSSWMYQNLLAGTDVLPEVTKAHIKSLVGTEMDPLKKARIVYEYVQGKTRYISIQLGIGGWKPMKAADVDRLGYGDCKALTNYTRALLAVAGVESYYAVVYGDQAKRDLQPDFVSMQGNHVILAIPHKGALHWLECTNQTMPFGFLGDFTDDRLALPIKSSGAGLVRTTSYDFQDNLQLLKGSYAINPEGTVTGTVLITSKGIQYDNKMSLSGKSTAELIEFYRKYFATAPNLKVQDVKLTNEREIPAMHENLSLKSERYGSLTGDRVIFPVNFFNVYQNVPKRYRSRSQPLQILRGFSDADEVEFEIPQGFTAEAVPGKQSIDGKFGQYQLEVVALGDQKFKLIRKLTVRQGIYTAADYDEYRKFSEQVAKADASKMVIVKT